jgi:hypothetical protein
MKKKIVLLTLLSLLLAGCAEPLSSEGTSSLASLRGEDPASVSYRGLYLDDWSMDEKLFLLVQEASNGLGSDEVYPVLFLGLPRDVVLGEEYVLDYAQSLVFKSGDTPLMVSSPISLSLAKSPRFKTPKTSGEFNLYKVSYQQVYDAMPTYPERSSGPLLISRGIAVTLTSSEDKAALKNKLETTASSKNAFQKSARGMSIFETGEDEAVDWDALKDGDFLYEKDAETVYAV